MLNLIKTILTKNDNIDSSTNKDILDSLLISYQTNIDTNKLAIFSNLEVEYLNYIKEVYEKLGEFPTIDLFCDDLGVEKTQLEKATLITDYRSLRIYAKSIINNKFKQARNREIAELSISGTIDDSSEAKERINKLMYMQDKVERVYSTKFDFKSDYADRSSRPVGMKWPSRVLNEKAGEIAEGEVAVIAGYTSHMKTTLAMNIVHNNVFDGGYNLVYFSLETNKDSMWTNLISRHSIGLDSPNGIPAKKVKRLLLSKEEYEQFDKANQHWEENRQGNLFFIDEMDLNTKDPMEFKEILEEIDDLLQGNLHGFVIDYIQILKNSSYSQGKSDARAVGDYMEMFRTLTQSFRKGTKYEKKLSCIILSQIKRDAVKDADGNGGEYSGPSVMSDSSELEKSAHVVVSTYTNQEMKASKQAYVQVLKARNGEITQPELVSITGDTYFYGDLEILDEGMNFDEMDNADISDLLGDAINTDIFSGGGLF